MSKYNLGLQYVYEEQNYVSITAINHCLKPLPVAYGLCCSFWHIWPLLLGLRIPPSPVLLPVVLNVYLAALSRFNMALTWEPLHSVALRVGQPSRFRIRAI